MDKGAPFGQSALSLFHAKPQTCRRPIREDHRHQRMDQLVGIIKTYYTQSGRPGEAERVGKLRKQIRLPRFSLFAHLTAPSSDPMDIDIVYTAPPAESIMSCRTSDPIIPLQ